MGQDVHGRRRRRHTALFAALGLLVAAQLPAAIHILQAEASPDGRWRVELADYNFPYTYELFATNLRDGVRRKIGKPTAIVEDVVHGFLIADNSREVIYTQRNTALGTDRQLYSATIDGSSWQRISQPMVLGGGVEPGFRLAWDGLHVHYEADPWIDEQFEWFVVALRGGQIVTEVFRGDFESGGIAAWH